MGGRGLGSGCRGGGGGRRRLLGLDWTKLPSHLLAATDMRTLSSLHKLTSRCRNSHRQIRADMSIAAQGWCQLQHDTQISSHLLQVDGSSNSLFCKA